MRTKTQAMYSRTEIITPEIARDILENHNPINRPISPATIQKYKNDMLAGRFELTHQGMAFDKYGDLVDGQHRLLAIIAANKEALVYVTYNANRSIYCDQQRKRREKDSLNYVGDMPFTLANYQLTMATLSIMISQKRSSGSISLSEKKEWILENCDSLAALELANSTTTKIGRMASVTLAMLSAYKSGYPAEDIIRWCEVLSTGLINDLSEQSAVMLRNHILNGHFNSQGERIQLVKTCQNNLYHFLNKDTIKQVKRPTTFTFEIK